MSDTEQGKAGRPSQPWPARVRDLLPGDQVTRDGQSAVFVSRGKHPLWPMLQLVTWLLDGSVSLDALDEMQEVGEITCSSKAQRQDRLRDALEWSPAKRMADLCEKLKGKTVRCTVPTDSWSDDWHDGLRARVYVGTVCCHHEGGFCLQPPPRGQGIPVDRAQCFPLTERMRFEELPGGPGDY